MHDYTIQYPQCTSNDNYLLSDCGSAGWAYALFITWNVLSMCESPVIVSRTFALTPRSSQTSCRT